jgi:AcrR family transcriptional regulator
MAEATMTEVSLTGDPSPRGREDVRHALIVAAAELFAARGPAAVTVREIAGQAQVNHGLVHRHFGSKGGLLRAVLDHLRLGIEAEVGHGRPGEPLGPLLTSVLGATSSQGAWLRVLAWAILDGVDVDELRLSSPLAERMVAAARLQPGARLDPEARVTMIMSVGLGMMLFAPFLQRATGQDDVQWARSRKQILSLVTRDGT